jgi:hypothetical protein
MMLWVESQSTAVIALVLFAICYALAAVAFALSALLARHRLAGDLKTLTPVLLTPLSVITGLLIAFLATRVWANLDRANDFVVQEATALHDVVTHIGPLPADIREPTAAGVVAHLHFIETQDWPNMLAGSVSLQQESVGLNTALAVLLTLEPTTFSQHESQARAIAAIERAMDARRGRIMLSSAVIAPAQWAVILTLDLLVLITIGVVHLDRKATAALGMVIFSTAVAASLILLMINDRPFSRGGNVVEPVAFRQIAVQLAPR